MTGPGSVLLLTADGGLRPDAVEGRLLLPLDAVGLAGDDLILLGTRDGAPVFAGATEAVDAVPLRAALDRLSAEDAALVSRAAALVRWHAATGFCPRCGGATTATAAGRERHCSFCGAQHFPRTDPVVTMLLTDGDRCLLSRRNPEPSRKWSALAGFVDAGETAEAAVARESWEEVGLRVADVRYVGSQSWPFPSQLMLAFRAHAHGAPQVDRGELHDAAWWQRDQLQDALDGDEIEIPSPAAIGHRLITEWLADG